ncbi:hypothetical protein [Dongia sp. agr-C8]
MMRRRAILAWFRPVFGPAMACGLAVAVVLLACRAEAADIDRERANAARALAQRYWREAGLDKLPASYDRARFEKAVGGEDDPYNIVAAIAVATLTSNPERKESVLRYLNEALLPYARAHKEQYLCLVSEIFYNSSSSNSELQGLSKGKNTNEGVAIAFIDYAYFLIKTERERDKLGLVLPGNSGIPEAVASFKKTLSQDGGAMIPEGAVKLGCSR